MNPTTHDAASPPRPALGRTEAPNDLEAYPLPAAWGVEPGQITRTNTAWQRYQTRELFSPYIIKRCKRLATGQSRAFAGRRVICEGRQAHVILTVKAVAGHYVYVLTDITQEVSSGQIRTREREYLEFFEQYQDPIVIVDEKQVLDANKAAHATFGPGRGLIEKQLTHWQHKIREVLKTGLPMRVPSHDEERAEILQRCTWRGQRAVAIMSIFANGYYGLQREYGYAKTALDHTPNPVAVVDSRNRQVAYANTAFHQLFGEITDIRDVLSAPNDHEACPISVSIQETGSYQGAITVGTQDKPIQFDLQVRPTDEHHFVFQFNDVTEHLAAEEAIIQAQEREQFRLAAGLHDEIGPQFVALQCSSQGYADKYQTGPISREELLEDFHELTELAVSAAESSRRLLIGLSPYKLVEEGFVNTVNADMARFTRTHNNLIFDFDEINVDEIGVQSGAEDLAIQHLYLITREAMENARKHATDGELVLVSIVYNAQKDELCLKVVDDGPGFVQSNKFGLGSRTMAARARALGAALKIDGSNGTSVQLTISQASEHFAITAADL